MLVLTRRKNESVVIGIDCIKVTVLSCQDGRVKLGIEAPADVAVHRQEVAAGIARDGFSIDPPARPAAV